MKPPLRERAIERAVRLARPLLGAVARPGSKLERGVRGREGAADRLVAWAGQRQDPQRPIVWMHAPSVGEGLMAQAIITQLRELRPAVEVLFTYFSPSAERILDRVGADHSEWLPWDTDHEAGRAVHAVHPAVLACVRTEVWPVLARSARRAGARVALVNAVLSEGSGRARLPGRLLLGPSYAALDAVGAIGPTDERMFRLLGVPPERLRLTGDARFDQVTARVRALRDDPARRAALRELVGGAAFTLVAGSTWPADEERLVPALASLGDVDARWVLAPHEPSPEHLAGLEARLAEVAIESVRLSALEAARSGGGGPASAVEAGARAVIVDRLGVLADLYAVADVAWVGGGFGRDGLHSVVEPAALDVPVLFGPAHGNSREAAELVTEGGGAVVRDAAGLGRRLRELATDPAARMAMAARAAEFVRVRRGGARRNALLLAELLDGSVGRQGST